MCHTWQGQAGTQTPRAHVTRDLVKEVTCAETPASHKLP